MMVAAVKDERVNITVEASELERRAWGGASRRMSLKHWAGIAIDFVPRRLWKDSG